MAYSGIKRNKTTLNTCYTQLNFHFTRTDELGGKRRKLNKDFNI